MENKTYKHDDYDFRSSDPYALTKYKIIMDWLPTVSNQRVLNVGCGSGEMNALLAMRDASWQVDAIDVDEEAIVRSTQSKLELGLTNIRIIQSAIETYEPGTLYDIVVSNDVLEHIEDDIRALAKMVALLKPAGILCVSVPALQAVFGYHDEFLGHYRRYNRKLLRSRLSPYFDIQHDRYFGMLLVPVAFYFSRLRHQPYPLETQRDKASIASRIVSASLALERRVPLPLGTSLLAMGVKRG